MNQDIEYNLFEQVRNKLEDNDNKLARELLDAVEKAYENAGNEGVQKLFLDIRDRYVRK